MCVESTRSIRDPDAPYVADSALSSWTKAVRSEKSSLMSPQSDAPSPSPSPSPSQELLHDLLACFDAYAQIRGRGNSLLQASRTTPQQEQRAFDYLEQAVTRLRNALE